MAEQNACAQNLGANILNDCNDDYGKGVEKIVYIIKKEDIDRKASKIAGNVISTLVLRTGKKAYTASAPSNTPFSGLTYEDQNATIGMSFNKTIPIVMLADSPTNALNIRTQAEQVRHYLREQQQGCEWRTSIRRHRLGAGRRRAERNP